MQFDWYTSPADRFSYENQFSKSSKNDKTVELADLESVFQLSRINQEDFLQIWNLIDIKGEQRINKEQFIYFMHVLTNRRKGKAVPVGIPLNVKEAFLKEEAKSNIYVRPKGTSLQNLTKKTVPELQQELNNLSKQLEAKKVDKQVLEKQLADSQKTQIELDQVSTFKKKQLSALQEDLARLKQMLDQGGDDNSNQLESLLSKLQKDKEFVDNRKAELQRLIGEADREIAKIKA